MSLLAFTLVLCAAVCHATWNFFLKKINGGPELTWLFSCLVCIIYFPAAAYVVVVERPSFGHLELAFIIGSTLLHLGYFLLLQAGYRKGDLSLVYPTARATGPLLSVTMAVLILGESVTAQLLAGAGLIVFGVVNLTGGFKKRASNVSVSLAFGLGSGTFIGGYTVLDAYAVSVLMIHPILLDYATGVARATLLLPYGIKRWSNVKQLWRDHKWPVLIIATVSPLAYILVLYAMTFTPVVYVAPLRETSVLLTVFAGSIILGEGNFQHRILWALVILAGVSLLATG